MLVHKRSIGTFVIMPLLSSCFDHDTIVILAIVIVLLSSLLCSSLQWSELVQDRKCFEQNWYGEGIAAVAINVFCKNCRSVLILLVVCAGRFFELNTGEGWKKAPKAQGATGASCSSGAAACGGESTCLHTCSHTKSLLFILHSQRSTDVMFSTCQYFLH